jgi:predicted nucleic acid-binding protein
MRLLIDTNIFLEVLLAQSRVTDAQDLLSKTEEHEFFMSDYTLHSIGLLFFRRKQHDVFRRFLADMFSIAGIRMISLLPRYMEDVIQTALKFGTINPVRLWVRERPLRVNRQKEGRLP